MNTYKPRIADGLLESQLKASGIVLIQGPKWCGKTTTGVQHAKSVIYMDDPRQFRSNLIIADSDPLALLSGDTPRLIDEWQLTPQLWDAARFEVSRRHHIQFMIVGDTDEQIVIRQSFFSHETLVGDVGIEHMYIREAAGRFLRQLRVFVDNGNHRRRSRQRPER